MDCPHCKYPDTKVIESRPDGNDSVRRRRQCLRCGNRMTTEEVLRQKKREKDKHVFVT